jgi:hypothetical protein
VAVPSHPAARGTQDGTFTDTCDPSRYVPLTHDPKDEQVNVKLPKALAAWLLEAAGGRLWVPGYIRGVLAAHRAEQEEARLLAMFNAAADSMTDEDRAAHGVAGHLPRRATDHARHVAVRLAPVARRG